MELGVELFEVVEKEIDKGENLLEVFPRDRAAGVDTGVNSRAFEKGETGFEIVGIECALAALEGDAAA